MQFAIFSLEIAQENLTATETGVPVMTSNPNTGPALLYLSSARSEMSLWTALPFNPPSFLPVGPFYLFVKAILIDFSPLFYPGYFHRKQKLQNSR